MKKQTMKDNINSVVMPYTNKIRCRVAFSVLISTSPGIYQETNYSVSRYYFFCKRFTASISWFMTVATCSGCCLIWSGLILGINILPPLYL